MSPLALDAALLACITMGVADLAVLNLSVVPAWGNPSQAGAGGRPARARTASVSPVPASLPLAPRQPPLADGAEREPEPTLVATVEFQLESRRLDPRARYRLRQSFPVLRAAAQITVVGHADATGAADYNDRLSQERADAAIRFLLAQGIRPKHISSLARGASAPLPRGNGRRVEIYIGGTR